MPTSSAIRHTPVSSSPARIARSTGAAPRHRGSSEKCRFTIGTRSRTCSLMSLPKATTTPSSTSASSTASTWWATGMLSSVAAALTGLGTSAPPRPRLRSGWVMTMATSWPSSTSARSGGTAASGVPRNASLMRTSVLCAHAASQLAHGFLALVGVEQFEQQATVEVVELVLEQAGEQLVGLEGHLVAVEVVAGEVDLLWPHDREVQARHRQAALLVLPLTPHVA